MTTPPATPSPPLTASVRIAAPPDVVFPYFTDATLAVRWLAETAELDARPGGSLALDVRGGGRARGTFVEVDPPYRVVFSWGVLDEPDLPPGSSMVEVVLEEDGDDTVVTLTHRGLPERFRPSHEEGWNHWLGVLGPLALGEAG